jgi:hypothetical protein
MQLYEVLARRVDAWRDLHYPSPEHDAIGEILGWAAAPETAGFRLRPPQLRALETYWYLRLVERTPHIFDLYQTLFPLEVTIQDFISPSILERLKQQAGILSPQIDDWRAMVDSVMIDSAYDSHIFNISLADVPERKSDLVSGEYELAAPTGPTAVAVKITDMLGEEVLEERHV